MLDAESLTKEIESMKVGRGCVKNVFLGALSSCSPASGPIRRRCIVCSNEQHARFDLYARPHPLQEADVLTEAILEFGKEYPGMIGPLLTERNLYMVYMMRKLAAHASSVVAVVGAGHLQGIR